MALFRKKSKTPNLEPELAGLRQRADALDAKRVAAEVELTAATEARQRHHIEGDLDDARTAQALQDRVNVAASAIVGLEDAIAVVQAQIADIERKLNAERTQAERAVAADKLARDLDGIEKALPDYLAAARRFADAAEKIGHWHFESGEMGMYARNTQAQIETAAAFAVQELRGMVNAIRDGSMPIPPKKPEPALVPVTEPAPETRRLFTLLSIKWRDENGKLRVVDQYCDVDLPERLVGRALRKGACISINDDRRKQHIGAHGGRHPNPEYAVDLDGISDASGAQYSPPNQSDPVAQANFTPIDRGGARTGTITVHRVV
jgi:hypothetical protein